jgi:hypothetical protein
MDASPYEYGDDERDWRTIRALVTVHGFQVADTYIRESFSTPDVLALMWLFTRVGTDVNGQRTPLDEALAATWGHA